MAFPLGRPAITRPPRRLSTYSRRASTSSTQSGPKPTQRGGRNLSLRYQQLESPVRSTARKVALLEMANSSPLVRQRVPLPVASKSQLPCEKVEIFHGLVVPQEPKPPEPDECCMSGCAICVYDLYEDSLLAYNMSLASLRTRLKSMGIPQLEWPSRIRSSPNSPAVQRPSNPSLDAFEAMERALEAKQQGCVEGDESLPKTHPTQFQFIPMLYEGIKWVVFSNR